MKLVGLKLYFGTKHDISIPKNIKTVRKLIPNKKKVNKLPDRKNNIYTFAELYDVYSLES